MGAATSDGWSEDHRRKQEEKLNERFESQRIFRFSAFELRSATGELLKHGVRIRLQIKPLQVLQTLLERPAELVTREELRQKLWPSGTFVDFESGLNTAINRLRSALGDSAEQARYIETLPRLGYRFICPIEPGSASSQTLPPMEIKISHSVPEPTVAMATHRNIVAWAAGILFLLLAGLSVGLWSSGHWQKTSLRFSPVSFQGGSVMTARFLTDKRIVYSAKVRGSWQTFVSDSDGGNGSLLLAKGPVLTVSNRGDLAVLGKGDDCPSQLYRAAANGRRMETLAEGVSVADWDVQGRKLAVVRKSGIESLLEYPIGTVIYRSQGWINSVRVSRNGREVAFLEHPIHDDDAGHVRIINTTGNTIATTEDWGSADGLAWSPSGKHVWFTASEESASRNVYSLGRSGKVRKLSSQPQNLRLLDVSTSGQVLLATDDLRVTMRAAVSQNEAERDISQFDFSHIDDISRDGSVLLFTEAGDAGGQHYSAFTYDQRTQTVKRLGMGRALSISSDGTKALTVDAQDRSALSLVDISSGETHRVPSSKFRYQWAHFFTQGHFLVGGAYPSQPLVMCLLDEKTGSLSPISDAPYFEAVTISPDQTKIAGQITGKSELFDLTTRTIHRLLPNSSTTPVAWGADSDSLYLFSVKDTSYSILKMSVATQQAAAWKTIVPENSGTFLGLANIVAAPSSGAYAYSSTQLLSRMYVVKGLS
jgi:eukaryotic-like serine/threonine-protein kinase